MKHSIWITVLVMVLFDILKANGQSDDAALVSRLMTNYSMHTRPSVWYEFILLVYLQFKANSGLFVIYKNVTIGGAIIFLNQIVSMDTSNQIMTSSINVYLYWQDLRY